MKSLKVLLVAFALLTVPFTIIGCEQEGPAEESLEEVGDEIDDATESLRED